MLVPTTTAAALSQEILSALPLSLSTLNGLSLPDTTSLTSTMPDVSTSLLDRSPTSMSQANALVNILPAPSANLFWASFFGLVVVGALNPKLSGLKVDIGRLLTGNGNLPIAGVQQFNLSQLDYNGVQKYRHQFGYVVAFFLIVAGGIAGFSDLLEDAPELQDYARSAILSLGVGAIPTHYLFNKERYEHGTQLVKTFGLVLCAVGQAVFCGLTYLWLLQVQEVVGDGHGLQLFLLTASIYGVYATFLLLNAIRVWSYLIGGEEYFFEPQREAMVDSKSR